MNRTLVLVVGLMIATVALPSGQAATAGASGECYDDGSGGVTDGGGDDAEVRTGSDSSGTVTVDALTAVGTAEAVVQLAEGASGEGSPPSNSCDGNAHPDSGDTGYIEVHATAAGTGAQVCWNGNSGDAVTVGGTTCATDTQDSDGPQVTV